MVWRVLQAHPFTEKRKRNEIYGKDRGESKSECRVQKYGQEQAQNDKLPIVVNEMKNYQFVLMTLGYIARPYGSPPDYDASV